MPTSDAAPIAHPFRRFAVRFLIVLATVIATDVALSFALEPFAGSTELMWSEYRQADAIDCVFIGSSATGYGIAPDAFDEVLGTHSFNMGTPGQTVHDSLASLKAARRDHKVSRAVICVGYETILEYPFVNSSVVFTQAKCAGESLPEAAEDILNLVGYPYYFKRTYSLSCAFPWAYNHVEITPDAIAANLERRRSMDTLEAAAAYAEASNDEGWHYWGQGYDGYTITMDTTSTHGFRYSSHPQDAPLIQETLDALDELCAYAQEQDIKLYVVGAAYVPAVLMEYGESYVKGMAEVKRIADAHGATFFDLNMVKGDVFTPTRSCYFNQVHLNRDGAELAASAIARINQLTEAGADPSSLCHPYTAEGWQAWQDSLDFVDSVDYASLLDGTRVLVEATAVTGPTTQVEYRLERREGEVGPWTQVRDWSDSPVFEFEGTDQTRVRVEARAKGTQQDLRACEGTIV